MKVLELAHSSGGQPAPANAGFNNVVCHPSVNNGNHLSDPYVQAMMMARFVDETLIDCNAVCKIVFIDLNPIYIILKVESTRHAHRNTHCMPMISHKI